MPVLEAQEGNVQFVSIAAAGEMCIAVRISFTVANRSSCEAVICLPFSMVRMLLDTLQTQDTPVQRGPRRLLRRRHARAARERSRRRGVPVSEFHDHAGATAHASGRRQSGLGHPKGRPLEVRAEGLLVALAEICSSGVHKACEIKEEVTK